VAEDQNDEEMAKHVMRRLKNKLEEGFFFNKALISYDDSICKPTFVTEKLSQFKDNERIKQIRERYQDKFLNFKGAGPEAILNFNSFIAKVWPTKLDISSCGLGPDHKEQVLNFIKDNENLEELYLDNNNLGFEFYKELCSAVVDIGKLQILSLKGCAISEEVA